MNNYFNKQTKLFIIWQNKTKTLMITCINHWDFNDCFDFNKVAVCKTQTIMSFKLLCYSTKFWVEECFLPSQLLCPSSYPALQLHFPMGTSHSPSALQCILGGMSVSTSELFTHDPLTSTRVEKAASATVSGNTAKFCTVDKQRL